MKFDVIVGNPPFNPPWKENKSNTAHGRTLWPQFVVKYSEILAKDGICCVVLPSQWRTNFLKKKSGKCAQDWIWNSELIYYRQCVADFYPWVGMINIDYLLFKNTYQSCQIFQDTWEIHSLPNEMKYIPLFKMWAQLVSTGNTYNFNRKSEADKGNVICKRGEQPGDRIYPLYFTRSKRLQDIWVWNKIQPYSFPYSKVIISDMTKFDPHWVEENKCGCAAGSYYICDKILGDKLVTFLNSEIISTIIKQLLTNTSRFRLHIEPICRIPKILVDNPLCSEYARLLECIHGQQNKTTQ